jgi:hypothetical protein
MKKTYWLLGTLCPAAWTKGHGREKCLTIMEICINAHGQNETHWQKDGARQHGRLAAYTPIGM